MRPLRFRPKLREVLLANKRGLDFLADMAGKPRLEPHPLLLKPQRASPVRNPNRISEAQVNETIREFSATRDDLVLWRNNSGVAQDSSGHTVRYGVGPRGASDWIGYKVVEITEGMVGKSVAVFTACEAKAPDAGAPDDAQIRFINRVNNAGGIALIVRERNDLEKL